MLYAVRVHVYKPAQRPQLRHRQDGRQIRVLGKEFRCCRANASLARRVALQQALAMPQEAQHIVSDSGSLLLFLLIIINKNTNVTTAQITSTQQADNNSIPILLINYRLVLLPKVSPK